MNVFLNGFCVTLFQYFFIILQHRNVYIEVHVANQFDVDDNDNLNGQANSIDMAFLDALTEKNFDNVTFH